MGRRLQDQGPEDCGHADDSRPSLTDRETRVDNPTQSLGAAIDRDHRATAQLLDDAGGGVIRQENVDRVGSLVTRSTFA